MCEGKGLEAEKEIIETGREKLKRILKTKGTEEYAKKK